MTKLHRTPHHIELARTSCSPSAGYCLSFQIKELPGRRFHTWLREDLSLKYGVIYNNNADPAHREATLTHSAEAKLWSPTIGALLEHVEANGLKDKAEDLMKRQLAEEEAESAKYIALENLKNDAEEMLKILRGLSAHSFGSVLDDAIAKLLAKHEGVQS